MELIIKGEPKEIADFVSQLQSQQNTKILTVVTNRNANDLVIENDHKWKVTSRIGRC